MKRSRSEVKAGNGVRRSARAPAPSGENTGARRVFLYAHVADTLRQRIRDGVYRPGLALPTERELVGEFRVSAITVRRAIRELTAEHLVFGQQGVGVFVTDSRRIVRTLRGATTSMADEIRRGGLEPGFKEHALELVPATPDVAASLGVTPGAQVYRHEKTVLADNEAIGVDTTVLPLHIGDLIRENLSSEFLITLLDRHGIRVDHQDYRFEGGTLTRKDAAVLGLPPGFPMIVISYTAFDEHGVALCTGRTVARSDRFLYEFCEKPGKHPAASHSTVAR